MPSKWLIFALLVATTWCASVQEDASTNGTSLWRNLIEDCKKPTMECVQKNVYKYFDDALGTKDVSIASFLKLSKNDQKYDPETEDEEHEETGRSTPIEDVSNGLRNKAFEFAFTHDMELNLPDFFGGGIMRISPRSSEGSGALLKVDFEPRSANEVSDPRFFKKIKKFISGKLVMALMAILLVIKLISVKFMFFLPMVMGVAAAKKLLLKVLLFLFPVLGHLFKLCPYYSPTKFHHHHHQISHLHHLPHGPSLHGGIELDHPPPGWEEKHQHQSEDFGYYSDGASFGPDFSTHRKDYDVNKPHEDAGQGHYGGPGHRGQIRPQPPSIQGKQKAGPLTPTEIENMVLKAEKEAMLKARLQDEQKRVESENKKLQDQIKNAMKLQEKLKIQSIVAKQSSKIAVATANYQNPNMIHPQIVQPHIVHAVPASHMHQQNSYLPQPMLQSIPQGQMYQTQMNDVHRTQPINSPVYQAPIPPKPVFDAFYSPILEKIDKVLIELGFHDEACRERLVCSMYKNPSKFSPHSNLISAELSREASELQKPTSSNSAVIRFYKYVQAARDGQDKRDCMRLYPTCAIVTE
ncbi:PREDICTED: uncharacterized protein LOC108558269 [Nicrophorus vespilloides]|uniref:Uncharacterized protein LOC108558269 n=1 Tax=Nicrophorus vespilloides TaxID=110193 RepID=A0ABM1M7R7_NICVS|nr:PREDICTED: uncharacterized protein LOC108558269 [Nicrophorus vespilloides]